jgi:prevent-host-death family protein
MKSTYNITAAQKGFPGIVKETARGPVPITRHQQTVAYLVSADDMEAMVETMGILENPAAMKAIQAYEAGKMAFIPLDTLDED